MEQSALWNDVSKIAPSSWSLHQLASNYWGRRSRDEALVDLHVEASQISVHRNSRIQWHFKEISLPPKSSRRQFEQQCTGQNLITKG